jgi:hypothetical protein
MHTKYKVKPPKSRDVEQKHFGGCSRSLRLATTSIFQGPVHRDHQKQTSMDWDWNRQQGPEQNLRSPLILPMEQYGPNEQAPS